MTITKYKCDVCGAENEYRYYIEFRCRKVQTGKWVETVCEEHIDLCEKCFKEFQHKYLGNK